MNTKWNFSVLVGAFSILFISCDTRADFNKDNDQPPVIQIRHDDINFQPLQSFSNQIYDSMKLSQVHYPLELNANTTLINPGFQFNINLIGSSSLNLISNQINSNSATRYYYFQPNGTGFKTVSFQVSDVYNLQSTATLQLLVFNNLPPIANFIATQTGQLDPLQFQIDASSSYDRDAKYGGTINTYEFTITPNYRVTTNQPVINYIFPKVGNYQIALRVQDNDSVWSASKVAWVNVQ